jgi:hypothetical protein
MRIPVLEARVDRKLLILLSTDPVVLANRVPPGRELRLQKDRAILYVQLTRYEKVRLVPTPIGFGFDEVAYYIALEPLSAKKRETRRDQVIRVESGSAAHVQLARVLQSCEIKRVHFSSRESASDLDVNGFSGRGEILFALRGLQAPAFLPGLLFQGLPSVAEFFEWKLTPTGYEPNLPAPWPYQSKGNEYRCFPFEVTRFTSTFLESENHFPVGAFALDHALWLRRVAGQWESAPERVASSKLEPTWA